LLSASATGFATWPLDTNSRAPTAQAVAMGVENACPFRCPARITTPTASSYFPATAAIFPSVSLCQSTRYSRPPSTPKPASAAAPHTASHQSGRRRRAGASGVITGGAPAD